MASDLRISTVASNAAIAAITARIDGGGGPGRLELYSGTRPSGPDAAITTQTLLVTLTLSATSFGAPTNRQATANAITNGNPVADGVATWGRFRAFDGVAVIDGEAGVNGKPGAGDVYNISLGSTTISQGVPVSIQSAVLSHT